MLPVFFATYSCNLATYGCIGLDGYYLDKKLVLIDATYNAELGFSSKKYYIDQEKFVEIIYREYFAEWEKYEQKYPSEKYEFDASKMTYTDTIYTISFATPTILTTKNSDSKIIGLLLPPNECYNKPWHKA